jgi:serpin B
VIAASSKSSAVRTVLEPHSLPPLDLNDDVQQKFARSHAAFTWNTFHKLSANKSEENFVFSPVSLQLALGMIVVGARGGGENRLARAMAPGVKPERIYEVMQSWQEQLLRSMNTPTQPGSERVGVLRFANSLWLDDSVQPNSAFVDKSKQYYGMGVFRLPIRGASSSALGIINSWVSEQTDSRIVNLVKKLTDADIAVLLSAAYFKTKFVSPFGGTESEPFASKSGNKGSADMLHNVLRTRYVQNLAYQAVELDLLYGSTSLVSIMPMGGSIESFVHGLSAQKWDQILKDLEHKKGMVDVHWPKVDFRSHYDNLEVSLGLPPAPIALPFISSNCQLASLAHEATFVVNKDGIEVPSAAGTTMQSGTSSSSKDDGTLVMRFDHPFVFAVIHRLTGSILFVGQVAAP